MGLHPGAFPSSIFPQPARLQGAAEAVSATPGQESSSGIPQRKFGRHEVQVSALGFGGHHLGDTENEQVAIRMVQEAVDNGITFFDNCWEYHYGKAEDWM